MKQILFIIIIAFVVSSCSTTGNITPNIDLSRYTIAAMGTAHSGSATVLNDAQMRIQNALISQGFDVIPDTRIGTLSYTEQTRLLIVTFSMRSDGNGTVWLISFTDHLSDNLIATFRSFSAWSSSSALNGAIRRMATALENEDNR